MSLRYDNSHRKVSVFIPEPRLITSAQDGENYLNQRNAHESSLKFFQKFEEKIYRFFSALGDEYIIPSKLSILSHHPFKPWVGVSLNGSFSVFDHDKNVWLIRSIQDMELSSGIYCASWLIDLDFILIGTTNGISVWKIAVSPGGIEATHVKDLFHPNSKSCNQICSSPSGRYFCSMKSCDDSIYIWDSMLLSRSTPLFSISINNTISSLSWQPSGSSILVSDYQGKMCVIDAIAWRVSASRSDCPTRAQSICWISDDICCVYSPLCCTISFFVVQNNDSFYIRDSYEVNTKLFDSGEILGIDFMCSNFGLGKLAISFVAINRASSVKKLLPFVVIYDFRISTSVSMSMSCIIYPPNQQSMIEDNGILPLNFVLLSKTCEVSTIITARNDIADDWVVVGDPIERSEQVVVKESVDKGYLITSWSNELLCIDELS